MTTSAPRPTTSHNPKIRFSLNLRHGSVTINMFLICLRLSNHFLWLLKNHKISLTTPYRTPTRPCGLQRQPLTPGLIDHLLPSICHDQWLRFSPGFGAFFTHFTVHRTIFHLRGGNTSTAFGGWPMNEQSRACNHAPFNFCRALVQVLPLTQAQWILSPINSWKGSPKAHGENPDVPINELPWLAWWGMMKWWR